MANWKWNLTNLPLGGRNDNSSAYLGDIETYNEIFQWKKISRKYRAPSVDKNNNTGMNRNKRSNIGIIFSYSKKKKNDNYFESLELKTIMESWNCLKEGRLQGNHISGNNRRKYYPPPLLSMDMIRKEMPHQRDRKLDGFCRDNELILCK